MANPRIVYSQEDAAKFCDLSLDACNNFHPPFQKSPLGKRVSSLSQTSPYVFSSQLGDINSLCYSDELICFNRHDGRLDEDARTELDTVERCDRRGFLRISTKNNQPFYTVVPGGKTVGKEEMVLTADGFIGPVVLVEQKSNTSWVLCVMRDTSYDATGLFADPDSVGEKVTVRRYKNGMTTPLSFQRWMNQMNRLGYDGGEGGQRASVNCRNLVSVMYRSHLYHRIWSSILELRPRSSSPSAVTTKDTDSGEKQKKKKTTSNEESPANEKGSPGSSSSTSSSSPQASTATPKTKKKAATNGSKAASGTKKKKTSDESEVKDADSTETSASPSKKPTKKKRSSSESSSEEGDEQKKKTGTSSGNHKKKMKKAKTVTYEGEQSSNNEQEENAAPQYMQVPVEKDVNGSHQIPQANFTDLDDDFHVSQTESANTVDEVMGESNAPHPSGKQEEDGDEEEEDEENDM
jgi:hypothetical protein